MNIVTERSKEVTWAGDKELLTASLPRERPWRSLRRLRNERRARRERGWWVLAEVRSGSLPRGEPAVTRGWTAGGLL